MGALGKEAMSSIHTYYMELSYWSLLPPTGSDMSVSHFSSTRHPLSLPASRIQIGCSPYSDCNFNSCKILSVQDKSKGQNMYAVPDAGWREKA